MSDLASLLGPLLSFVPRQLPPTLQGNRLVGVHLAINQPQLPILEQGLSHPARMHHLTQLNLVYRGEPGALIEVLNRCIQLSHLRELNLWMRDSMTAQATELLAQGFLAPSLQSLYIRAPRLNDALVQVLAASHKLHLLRRLMLQSDSRNGITPAAADILADSPHLSRLTSLTLRGTSIGDRGVFSLATAENVRRLRHLDLSHGTLTNEGARILSSAIGNLGLLESLDISYNAIDEAGLEELANLGLRIDARGQHQ